MRDTRAYPYGYEMINGVIVINTAEAEVVKQIYSDRLSGIGVYAIGKKLYEMQIPFFSEERDKAIKKAKKTSDFLWESFLKNSFILAFLPFAMRGKQWRRPK